MLDFTGGVLTYGYPLGAIAIKNAMGKGEPVAYIISSGESAEVVAKCLQILQSWLPKRFMIDKSKEIDPVTTPHEFDESPRRPVI